MSDDFPIFPFLDKWQTHFYEPHFTKKYQTYNFFFFLGGYFDEYPIF